MKKLYILNCAVMLLCIVGSAVLLILMPEAVPAHYNFAGEVDRFGSKYEYLLFPLFTVLMGAFFLWVAGRRAKTGQAAEEKILLYTGAAITVFFTLMSFYFMVKALRSDPGPAVSAAGVMKFTGVVIGALLILLGSVMPRARRNTLFGLRTKWSMANDRVWQKSQRFGGFSAVALGLMMIVLSVFLPGLWNIAVMTALTLIWMGACIGMSYRYYKQDAA